MVKPTNFSLPTIREINISKKGSSFNYNHLEEEGLDRIKGGRVLNIHQRIIREQLSKEACFYQTIPKINLCHIKNSYST
jgi:hypothetical protein